MPWQPPPPPLPPKPAGPQKMDYGDSNDFINGALGLNPGGRFDQNQYDPNAVQAAAQVQTAQGFDPAAQAQTRAAQTGLLSSLQQQAQGVGPSIADAQANHALDANAQQAGTFLAQNRGLSPGAAAQLGAQQLAQAQGQVNQQHVLGKLGEQMNAQQQLGQVASSARGQDLNLGQLQNQAGQFNAQQFNAQLGADAQAQNTLKSQQNQQIAAQEAARRGTQQKVFGGLLEGGEQAAGGLAKLAMI